MTSGPLDEEVRRRRERHERWARDGERPMAQNLALIGVVGWLVVAPMLLGIAVGRWLDRITGGGITFTAAGVFAGAIVGAAVAWRRLWEE
ncbi:MAG TPA: ATPase F0F1 [Polyangiaceae bacterium]|nr:ATPase F0F1 [Polyangiaceae bacterium]